jgi:hypothetical protein
MICVLTLAIPVLWPRAVAFLRPEIRRLHSLAWGHTQQASLFSMPSSFLPSYLFYTVTHSSLAPAEAARKTRIALARLLSPVEWLLGRASEAW